MIEVAALHLALSVLDQGSFRKVASSLNVRPSVVSRRIRVLEDTLGVSLFQRQSQGAQPTPAGRRILARGRLILADIETLVRTASLSGIGAEGHLCLGVVASIAGGTARELVRAFLTIYPGVDLDVVEGSPRENIAKTRSLRMDVVLVVGTTAVPGCDVEPLWSEAVHVAMPQSHPLAAFQMIEWDQLGHERFIVTTMDPGPEIEDFVIGHLAELGRPPVVDPWAVQREGLLALVGLGLGISLVGTAETAVSYPDVVFRPLAGEMLSFSAVWAPNNDNPALRRFLSLARIRTKGLLAPALSQTDGPGVT